MTEEQIDKVLDNIREIKENPLIYTGTIVGLTINPENVNHKWIISTDNNVNANYSVKLDSLDDAVNIIHKFSGNSKKDILKYFKNKYIPDEENYLHYIKAPIGQ